MCIRDSSKGFLSFTSTTEPTVWNQRWWTAFRSLTHRHWSEAGTGLKQVDINSTGRHHWHADITQHCFRSNEENIGNKLEPRLRNVHTFKIKWLFYRHHANSIRSHHICILDKTSPLLYHTHTHASLSCSQFWSTAIFKTQCKSATWDPIFFSSLQLV